VLVASSLIWQSFFPDSRKKSRSSRTPSPTARESKRLKSHDIPSSTQPKKR
jgi:hypothetical protein